MRSTTSNFDVDRARKYPGVERATIILVQGTISRGVSWRYNFCDASVTKHHGTERQNRVSGRAEVLGRDADYTDAPRELSHEVPQAVVCRRLPPIRGASVIEHWEAQCERRRCYLWCLRGCSDG